MRSKIEYIPLAVVLEFCELSAMAAGERLGLWVGTSDSYQSLRSVVELVVDGNEMFGRIERVIGEAGKEVDVICNDCPGEMNGKPMKGIIFITGLHRQGNKWTGGRVVNLEPGWRKGITAHCELEIKGSHVEFFGYKGLRVFGKKVIWPPYKE